MQGLVSALGFIETEALQLHGWAEEAISTAQIEGELLAVHSVRASVAQRLGLRDAPNTSAADYRAEATLDILQGASTQYQQDMSHETLFSWHAALFPTGRSGLSRIVVGGYRTHSEAMQIVTPRIGKDDIVHFQAPLSAHVFAQMQALLDWLNNPKNESAHALDGMIKAAIAHLWFETIHPFEDGNGRIGRALAEWVLAKDRGNGLRYYSVSQQIWLQRKEYYAALQQATGNNHLDITPWINWFLGIVGAACNASIAHVQGAVAKTNFWRNVAEKIPALNDSQRKVINKMFDVQPVGFSNGISTELYGKIGKVSRATAYRELTALVQAEVLEKRGAGRGTRYDLLT